MNPKLLIISLLLLVCPINGQGTDSLNPIAIVPLNQIPTIDLPSPQELDAGMAALNKSQTSRSSGTQADEQKFMGNKQVFSNNDLRAIMRDYNITLEEISKMLDQFIEGGEEAMTIQRTNPDTGLQEIVPFKELQSQRAAASIPSVSPRSNHLPGEVIHIGSDMGASTSRSGGAQADEQITVVYDDELRTLMRDYNISAEEIKQMLALYAQGGAATITKDRINPEFGFREIVTLDFEKFISQKPSVPITSVTPTAGPPSHPPQDAIQHLLSTEAYLQEQIKELDAQVDALNVAYQWGVIIKQTRDKNAKINRDQRRRFETDLRYIQMEISRRGGTEQRRIPGRYITPEQRAALRQELSNIRRRERIIFQLLRLLGNRNSRLLVPMVKDPFRQQLRRRVSFANGNRPKLTKTLSGSITGQDVPRRRVV